MRTILFTRFPLPGHAKTRLIPAVGADGAAQIHKRLTEQTVAILQSGGCKMEVHYTGAGEDNFRQWLGNDIVLRPQAEGDLTDRLLSAMGELPVIFYGSDTPDLTQQIVRDAGTMMAEHDVVIGPAEDGGYYCIGVNGDYSFLFEDMPWSSDQVFPETMRRIESAGLSCGLLPVLSDCDTPSDLARWPWLLR